MKLGTACYGQETGSLNKVPQRKKETLENNFNRAYQTRSRAASLKNDIFSTPLHEREKKVPGIPDTASQVAGASESNFRKTLLFKVKVARETQVAPSSDFPSDHPRNETPTSQLANYQSDGFLLGKENEGCLKSSHCHDFDCFND